MRLIFYIEDSLQKPSNQHQPKEERTPIGFSPAHTRSHRIASNWQLRPELILITTCPTQSPRLNLNGKYHTLARLHLDRIRAKVIARTHQPAKPCLLPLKVPLEATRGEY